MEKPYHRFAPRNERSENCHGNHSALRHKAECHFRCNHGGKRRIGARSDSGTAC